MTLQRAILGLGLAALFLYWAATSTTTSGTTISILFGSMFTIAKITAANGIQYFGRTTVDITNNVAYELAIEGINDRWVQRNLTTGEAIELLMPWEVDNKLQKDNRFDGLRPKPLPRND